LIKPKCDLKLSPDCEGELKQFGAILFSPPSGKTCLKYHVCKPCFDFLMEKVSGGSAKAGMKEIIENEN
jgi:hypothetical protein